MSAAPRKLDCNFALIDIEKRRHAIARGLRAGKRYRVLIEAELDTGGAIGRDDGTSIEFGTKEVTKAVISEIEA